MGIFSNSERSERLEIDAVDQYLAQRIEEPRVAMRPVEGETHLRVHGQTKYATIRANLRTQGKKPELPFGRARFTSRRD